MTVHKGKTEDAKAPILGADFWRPGVSVSGKVLWAYDTANGVCYALRLMKPVDLEGEPVEQVSIGGLRGFQMALQVAGLDGLTPGQGLYAKCTGITKATKKGHSDMINFEIEVTDAGEESDGDF